MKNKKGFTIVELVIVIAVIAILAAVLIPTFSGVVGKANVSARTQEFTNALKVVLAGNAETGALADKTIFVGSSKGTADYYAYYNGNKLDDITPVKKDNNTANLSASATDKLTVTYNGNQTVDIQSVILPFKDGTPNENSLNAAKALIKGDSDNITVEYAANKITVKEGTEEKFSLTVYSNLDLASGMFVLSPTN